MGRQISSPYPKVNRINSIVPVNKGGTNADNIIDAAVQLGALSSTVLGQVNGAAKLKADNTVDPATYPASIPKGSTFDGPDNFFVNGVHVLTITNKDAGSANSVSVSAGTVSLKDNKVTFTAPSTPGVVQLTLNGRVVNIQVKAASPVTPSIQTPVANATNIPAIVTVVPSALAVPTGSPSLLSADWELATDANFTNVILTSFNDTVNLTSWPLTGLTVSTDYYLRMRYKDSVLGYSAWSPTSKFTTKASFAISSEEAMVTASDKIVSGNFGIFVHVSSDGTRVVAGAHGATSNGIGTAGQAYVFSRSGTVWTQEQILFASDRATAGRFGYSAMFNSDATRLVIGAYGANSGGLTQAGQAYVFTRSGTIWSQEAILFASDRTASAYFGIHLHVCLDASRCIISAYQATSGGFTSAGQAYIFSRSGTVWTQEQILFASDRSASALFGGAVALNADATRCIVGGVQSVSGGFASAGQAYVYLRTGVTWSQEALLFASDRSANSYFGSSVNMSNDGIRLAVGAYQSASGGFSVAGQVYVFLRTGSSWAQEAILFASDRSASSQFGASLFINGDSTRMVIGANQANCNNISQAGQVYVFTRNGTVWAQESILSASDKAASASFGVSVSITPDGSRIAVGAYNSTESSLTGAGSAYVFS